MNLKAHSIYRWEMETADGVILSQFEPDGKENTWKTLDPDQVVRVSLLPVIELLPRHDVLIDISKGDKFIRRFGRGFLKMRDKFQLKTYLNCIVTNRCRFYVVSNGRCIVTHRDFEVRL